MAHVEVGGLLRRAQAAGGFGTVLRKGDPERGTLVLVIVERGEHRAILERRLQADWTYRWSVVGPNVGDSREAAQHLARARDQDPDCWFIELDVPSSERFIAETTAEG
ncbi:DUF1491 family protein [Sphingomonas sp. BN140010]|uniref:DUF1491 family protein n=1 Tax=Sphingomonas arvum TaxID=2992113 RepID=A0ABT3JFG1_9SPHN|nr:DUF1491 family protein [Sphingomonas sp. BN140010]MCW3797744.1 DUF1491 family protein [Sphingomonas sp. BN140010]